MDETATTPSANPADPYGLAPLWDALMEIYDAFAALATKHGWCWYLIAGNALGVVRHDGDFVPWDDDLDMSMPRKYYEELRLVANRELPPHLRWVDYQNTASYPYLFGKIMDVRPEAISRVEEAIHSRLPQGLFVDIWPMDGVPTRFFSKAKRWVQRQALRLVMEYRTTNPPMSWKQVVRHPLPFLMAHARPGLKTHKDFLYVMDAHARSLPMEKAEKTAHPFHRWYEQHGSYPARLWQEPLWAMFHGRLVPLPTDVHEHLRISLGEDYMTLPPPEKRHPTHDDFFEAPWKFGPDRYEKSE
ncbi:MAG: LicD family protein [Kiritimatiellae bacterium]|nr:LicD family protein [Kiritimatiellia bacterium]